MSNIDIGECNRCGHEFHEYDAKWSVDGKPLCTNCYSNGFAVPSIRWTLTNIENKLDKILDILIGRHE